MNRRRQWNHAAPYLCTLPAVLLLCAVMLVPLIAGISYAFHDITLLDPNSGDYVGWSHFVDLWNDPAFWGALANTLVWTLASVSLQFILGLGLALLLHREFRGRRLVQVLVFLPWAVPSFLSGLNWAWLFNPVVGPIPHVARALHLTANAENLLSSPTHALWGPIIANVWWGIPFFAITMLAALQSIPTDLYEAAAIDGADERQQFRSITLPYLAPTIVITILLRTVWIANFAELIVAMTKGGPADSTQILASYVFTQAFQRLDFGYASTIASVLLGLLLVYAAALMLLRRLILQRF